MLFFNWSFNRWFNNQVLSFLSKVVQPLFNSLYNSIDSYFNPIFDSFCNNYKKSQDIVYPIEELFKQLYLILVTSKWNIMGLCLLYYNIKNGCFLEGELFVFSTTVNTYLSNILLLVLLCIFCVISAYLFIKYTHEFKLKYYKIYKNIVVLFFICFLILISYLIYLLVNFYEYIIAKLLKCILKFGTPGPSGGNSQGGGQPSGSNPQGPQGPQGGNDGFGSASNSSDNERRDRRSRSPSPCTRGGCYYPDGEEDDNGLIKKCHKGFRNKTDARIKECNRNERDREKTFKPGSNIANKTGISYLDYTQHDLISGLQYLNDQHHNKYIVLKPREDTSDIGDYPLAGQAVSEKANAVLYLKDRRYYSLTNCKLASVVKKSWNENSRE